MIAVIHTLRQQTSRARGRAENYALSDFVAPKDSGIADYIGGFVVTGRMLAMFRARKGR